MAQCGIRNNAAGKKVEEKNQTFGELGGEDAPG